MNEKEIIATTPVEISEATDAPALTHAEICAHLQMIQPKENGTVKQKPKNIAANYSMILELDETFRCIRYNCFTERFERMTKDGTKEWGPEDDAWARSYLEEKYSLRGLAQWADAICQLKTSRAYNPIQEIVDSEKWDGVKHCEGFLSKWLKVDDSEYTREVSRLLFAGGIHRLYEPGCKFDCVPVLMGEQGSGKSTICHWLALDDAYHTSLTTIKGRRGAENIQGCWICELEELLAILSSKPNSSGMEEAKSFISMQDTYYRQPYTKLPVHHLRHNIFIGTTNQSTFVTDPTGGRRWFPVKVNSVASDLYDHEEECRHDILQAWAEMREAYLNGEDLASPAPNMVVFDEIRAQQATVQTEDYRIGLIEEYLKGKDSVCLLGVWNEGLGQFKSGSLKPETSRELAEILVNHFRWERANVERFGLYNKQKAFHRPKPVLLENEDPKPEDDDLATMEEGEDLWEDEEPESVEAGSVIPMDKPDSAEEDIA